MLTDTPLQDSALSILARAQRDVIELIQASLTCPMCFEYIAKGDVISQVAALCVEQGELSYTIVSLAVTLSAYLA